MSVQWTPLPSRSPLQGGSLVETLDGGQCFRWQIQPDGTWSGTSGHLTFLLRPGAPTPLIQVTAGSLDDARWHLADDLDWVALADQLPWRSDPHLARCLEAFPGLRILRQPIGEALLCFLCSATKQIVQIKQMVQMLADAFGDELAPGKHALPTWKRLADVPETQLRSCQLGFRARNVAAVAQFLREHPEWLGEAAASPYPEAKTMLLKLPGVGPKIADCVLLFGAGMLEAFPVDVWIARVMTKRYGLEGWSLDQIAHFGRVHFGPAAGLAQQYLFAWERQMNRRLD